MWYGGGQMKLEGNVVEHGEILEGKELGEDLF